MKTEQMCYTYSDVIVRKAVSCDLASIKKLADCETRSLGFTVISAIVEGIELGFVFVAEVQGEVVGFQQYYHRKRDLQTTLYRKTVAKKWRRQGIATKLVDAVVEEAKKLNREVIFLKCPIDNESNKFHLRYGFKKIRVDSGKRRKLNVYEYRLTA
ncbi:MAG TPA: GNAT family N-acetyltransferase [Anaerolineales bacterium]|nr:GNAT family N-acetyltransferase [Anaerolineales bacterium]